MTSSSIAQEAQARGYSVSGYTRNRRSPGFDSAIQWSPDDVDLEAVSLPAAAVKGLSPVQIDSMRENVALANQSLGTAGNAIRATAQLLSEIKEDLIAVKKKRNWTALTDSDAINMSGRTARDLAVAWETWLGDATELDESSLAKVSARTLQKIGTLKDAGKRKHAINKLKKGGKFTEADLNLITRGSGKKISFDDLIAKAKDKASGMSDEEKLEALADILLENIKLKKQIADLKAKK